VREFSSLYYICPFLDNLFIVVIFSMIMSMDNHFRSYYEVRDIVSSYLVHHPQDSLFSSMCEYPIVPGSFDFIFRNGKSISFKDTRRLGYYDFSTGEIVLDKDLIGLERDLTLAHELVHAYYGYVSYDGFSIPNRLMCFRNASVELIARNIVATPSFKNRMLQKANLSPDYSSIPDFMTVDGYFPEAMQKSVLRIRDLLPEYSKLRQLEFDFFDF